MGSPVLSSFSGMGEVLGWAPRLPVAALCDRKRIMSIWAKRCGGVIPQEYALGFTKVRSLSPEEFVRKLAKELQVSGVVAGEFICVALLLRPAWDRFSDFLLVCGVFLSTLS
ncbi:hypothetical protein R1flu_013482 [Riccia fluitans]|uniref:Uncharacterized protein n=1 Tax=Riccia fluitans TaxID=41844 RepID=A0ABD1YDD6_9MARC